MAGNLLESGLWLTLYGMGTVFIFLVLLISATRLMSGLVLRSELPNHQSGRAAGPVEAKDSGAELVAVISAAIRQHRKAGRRKVQ